jgi:apolipoprotein N-acyltransferase
MMLGVYGYLGCLGMSVIIVGVNTLFYLAVIDKKRRLHFIGAAAAIFVCVVMAALVPKEQALPSARHLRISVIQGNISPTEKMDAALFDRNVGTHLKLTEQSYKAAHPNLVIWPETAFPDDLLQSDRWLSVIKAQAIHMNADVLMGIAPIINGKEYNSALLVNARGQLVGLYHKQALVPFSETTPFSAWGIDWGRGYNISPGKRPGVFALTGGTLHLGVVICSESAHPELVAKLRREGADFLVEISNDAWFTDRPSCMLHAEAAVMRAVENRWWVIRVANTGFSFAVDPQGVIHTDMNIKLWREGFGIFDIMVNKPS